MKQYEITFLTTSEEDQGGVSALIGELGGRVLSQADPLRRKLSYAIKKETAAVYWTILFEIDPTVLPALNLKLLRNDHILRHLVIADGIRKTAETAPKKLKEKDLEVPESVVKGMAELAAQEQKRETQVSEPAETTPEEVTETPVEPTPEAAKDIPADELTADERQKKLDEKLEQILKQ